MENWMDIDMDKIYGNPEIGLEWIGESLSGIEKVEEQVDHSAISLVHIMKGKEERMEELILEIQENAEGMTIEERNLYFNDLDQAIVRLCD